MYIHLQTCEYEARFKIYIIIYLYVYMYKTFSYWSKIEFSKFVNKFIRYQLLFVIYSIVNLQNKVGEFNFCKS